MQAIKVGDDFSNCTELVRRLKDLDYSNTNIRNTTLALTDDGIRIVYKSEDSHNTKWVNFFNPTKKGLFINMCGWLRHPFLLTFA